jgi:hypothetical protein
MDNRSVLAYDIVPSGDSPVVVTIASEEGWSLVGVMASSEVDATGAVALLSARGLDVAMQPMAPGDPIEGAAASRLAWVAPLRSREERTTAKRRAQGGGDVVKLRRKPSAQRSEKRKTGKRR